MSKSTLTRDVGIKSGNFTFLSIICFESVGFKVVYRKLEMEETIELQEEMEIMRCVFGIDVSKNSISVAIVIDQTMFKETKLPLNRGGFRKLEEALQSFNNPEVVFEATGVYSRRLQRFLDDLGQDYTCLNPLVAKKQLDGLRPYKTDRNDARHLAETQFIMNRAVTYKISPVYCKLMDFSRFYQEVSKDVATHKNRLHRSLQLVFPEIEHVLSNTNNELYWSVVSQFSQASQVTEEYSFNEVVDLILKGTQKKISHARAEQIAHSLYSAARLSYSAVDDDSPVYLQVKHLVNQIQEETKLKASIIEQMTALAKELPEYNELLSIPGLGVRTVVSLIGELGDIRRFRNSNALNAFIGIDLRHYESGDYVANDHISKRGNTVARKILFKAIQNIASAAHYHPNQINDYYQRRKLENVQQGTKKIAIAAIHRLIRTIYHPVINNQFYDYTLATKG